MVSGKIDLVERKLGFKGLADLRCVAILSAADISRSPPLLFKAEATVENWRWCSQVAGPIDRAATGLSSTR
jgi:hypothetical protein